MLVPAFSPFPTTISSFTPQACEFSRLSVKGLERTKLN